MPDVHLARRAPGHLVLTLDGVAHDVRFPATGNLEQIVLKILGGQEYPVLRIPVWSPATIVDVGANVGATALFFALAYPDAQIRCFEPSPSTAGFLEANTAFLPQVTVHRHGLHRQHQMVRLYAGTVQCAQASVARSVETRGDRFETITLSPARDALADVQRPAILKLDTEGCEVPVLEDLGDALDGFDIVYVEYHSEKDRRRIDGLLGTAFSLWKASAHAVHRGTAAYLHQRLIDLEPRLGALEIDASLPTEPLAAAG